MYKFSIISVVYNSGSKLIGTLDSVVTQSYKNFEVIIVDGDSKDDTLSIACSYKGKVPDLQIISESDKGIYDAMNKGVKLAKGDYIYFLNAGDLFYDDMVLSDVSHVLDGVSLVYGNAISFGESNNSQIAYRTGQFSKYRLAHTNICHQTIFYPVSCFDNHSFNLRYKLFADWALNMELWRKVKFLYVDKNIVLYENGGVSATTEDKVFAKEQLSLVRKFLGLDSLFYLAIRKFRIWKL